MARQIDKNQTNSTPTEKIAPGMDSTKIPGGIISIGQTIKDFPAENITSAEPLVETMSEVEITVICDKAASTYGIHRTTALAGISEMIRRGGANNVTPGTFSIQISCPQEKVSVEMQKRDIVRLIEVVAPEKNFRVLANTLARDIIEAGLIRVSANPQRDQSGDLAKKISTRLAFRGLPPLTPSERVGCASYAQHLPDLNQITGSDRLSALLAEDLDLRRASANNKKKKVNKGFGSGPKKNTSTKKKKI